MWAETYRWEWDHNVKWAVVVERTPGIKLLLEARKGFVCWRPRKQTCTAANCWAGEEWCEAKLEMKAASNEISVLAAVRSYWRVLHKRGGHDLFWIDQSGCWGKIDSNNAGEAAGRLLSNSRHEIRVDLRQYGGSRSGDKRTDLRCILEIRWAECADDVCGGEHKETSQRWRWDF